MHHGGVVCVMLHCVGKVKGYYYVQPLPIGKISSVEIHSKKLCLLHSLANVRNWLLSLYCPITRFYMAGMFMLMFFHMIWAHSSLAMHEQLKRPEGSMSIIMENCLFLWPTIPYCLTATYFQLVITEPLQVFLTHGNVVLSVSRVDYIPRIIPFNNFMFNDIFILHCYVQSVAWCG